MKGINNPNGPYPGRQLFLGLTVNEKPAFAYLVTGRSPQSRERKAIMFENSIIMGPIGNQPYDPLRHYTAVKYDHNIGLAVVSNGIQTETIFETYKLLFHVETPAGTGYLKKIMDGARAEPDSYHTPRIAGVITHSRSKSKPIYIISIKTWDCPASTFKVAPRKGIFTSISTYKGNLDSPEAFDTSGVLPEIEFHEETAEELAEYVYNISSASYQGDDIRVCAIGGIRSADNHTWQIALINRHKS